MTNPDLAQPAPTAAFFDLDKTIIATNSAYAFGRVLVEHGLISPARAAQISLAKLTYMLAGMSSSRMDSERDNLAEMIRGWRESEMNRIIGEATEKVIRPAVYAEARTLIAQHQEAGRDVVIVSASVSHLVRPIAELLGVTDVVSSELEVVDDRFTGTFLAYLKGDAKPAAMRKLADHRGYRLAGSFAYSDSTTDIPMLDLVGHPVAVNPERGLRQIARERGWPIMRFQNPSPWWRRNAATPAE